MILFNVKKENIIFLFLGNHVGTGPNYVAITVAVICIIALMLPSSEDMEHSLWSILHLSSHQKMVFAYSLGLYRIFRPFGKKSNSVYFFT